MSKTDQGSTATPVDPKPMQEVTPKEAVLFLLVFGMFVAGAFVGGATMVSLSNQGYRFGWGSEPSSTPTALRASGHLTMINLAYDLASLQKAHKGNREAADWAKRETITVQDMAGTIAYLSDLGVQTKLKQQRETPNPRFRQVHKFLGEQGTAADQDAWIRFMRTYSQEPTKAFEELAANLK